MEAYHKWNNFFLKNFSNNMEVHYIYLTCEPEVCFERIHKRARGGEGGIPIEYLQRLHQCHCDWLNKTENVLVFDVNQDFTEDKDKLNKVSAFIEKYL